MATNRIDEQQLNPSVSVLILAGGESSRMGFDKAGATIDSQALVSRVVTAAAHLGPVTIVGGNPELMSVVTSQTGRSVEQVFDDSPGSGPFAALVSALGSIKTPEVLALSCDLAWLTSGECDLLLRTRRVGDSDIALPLVQGTRQWHGLAFATRVSERLVAAHASGVRSLNRGFRGCTESLVTMSSQKFFADVDTVEQLDIARAGFAEQSASFPR